MQGVYAGPGMLHTSTYADDMEQVVSRAYVGIVGAGG